MDVILDDGPFLDDRIDRPRSHTWPLPDPGLLMVDNKTDPEQSPEPCQPHANVQNDSQEGVKKFSEGASPRKNNRKNAWGNLSYADLITQAIDSSPEKRLTLAQIYEWMVKNVSYFKDKGDSTSSAGWKVSYALEIFFSQICLGASEFGTLNHNHGLLKYRCLLHRILKNRPTSVMVVFMMIDFC